MIKVSVIVAIYNSEKYISDCVKSIIEQSYDNLEIILVDDGSTDGSLSLCKSFEQADRRIKVFNFENGGVSKARNEGFKLCSGDYVLFVDSDDSLEKQMIETLVNCSNNGKIDIVQCGYYRVYHGGNKEKCFVYDSLLEGQDQFYKHVFPPFKTISNSIWSKLIRRKACSGVLFDPAIRIGEDLKFIIEVLSNCESIRLVPFCLYNYYVRQESVTNSSFSEKWLDDFVVNDWCMERFADNSFLLKQIKTKDASFCLDLYYLAFLSQKRKEIKRIIKYRLKKKDNHIFGLGFKKSFSIFIIKHFPLIFDLGLRIRFGKKKQGTY